MFNEDQSQKALGRNTHVSLCENSVKQLEEKQTAMHMKHLIKYTHSHTHSKGALICLTYSEHITLIYPLARQERVNKDGIELRCNQYI